MKVEVTANKPHEHAIVTEEQETGLFVARLVSNLAITQSLLIPEGLMYPDRRVIITV
jgi:hypothetical protein